MSFVSVATKKVVIEEPVFKREDDGNYTPSVGSFRSSATGRSKTSKASRRSTPSNTNADLDKTGKIIELDDDLEEEFGSFNSTGQMFDMLQKSVSTISFQNHLYLLTSHFSFSETCQELWKTGLNQ